MIRDTSVLSKLWITVVWLVTGFFVLNVLAVIAAVVVSSFGTRWLGTWLPDALTTRWYAAAWAEFQLDQVLLVTFQVVFAVVILSGFLGVTAAYAMRAGIFRARKSFC